MLSHETQYLASILTDNLVQYARRNACQVVHSNYRLRFHRVMATDANNVTSNTSNAVCRTSSYNSTNEQFPSCSYLDNLRNTRSNPEANEHQRPKRGRPLHFFKIGLGESL